MRELVDQLCSDACAGRSAGSPGGALARRHVVAALRAAGLDPSEQAVPKCGGANVLATIPGAIDRWVMVAAHYDHLGQHGAEIFRGATDNAAAVAILVDVARKLSAHRPDGRGVILAAFDAEEPPHFLTESMGSEHFARHPTIPLERIDLMVCLELVGHSLGEAGLPASVRETTFVLGAERCVGLGPRVDALANAEAGIVARRADATVIPPLSDYAAFWDRRRPFVLLTNGRSRHYHQTSDTPDTLDHAKMAATSRWIERLVREACSLGEQPFRFEERQDDVSTLDSLAALLMPLARDPRAELALEQARAIRARCGRDGRIASADRAALAMLVEGIEAALA